MGDLYDQGSETPTAADLEEWWTREFRTRSPFVDIVIMATAALVGAMACLALLWWVLRP